MDQYTNPYVSNNQQQNPVPPKKKKGGFAGTIAKTIVVALVFALVAAPSFAGVTYALNHFFDRTEEVASAQKESEGKQESESKQESEQEITQDKTQNETPIGSTNHSSVAGSLVDVSDIVKNVMPSIVSITNTGVAYYESYWGTESYDTESCGSGIIISQDDNNIYIVTNNHVVENATKISVQFFNEVTVEAQLKGAVANDDLAVVSIPVTAIDEATLKEIKMASISDSTQLQVGESAIAIGNALGYGQSVTTGVISALHRSVTIEDNSSTIIHNNLIQTDAAINPGNSGGALLNAKGEVIGINSAKYTDTSVEGIGYAIPITDAMKIVNRIITREKVEEEDAAALGIKGRDVTSAMASGYNWPMGVYVVEAIDGCAAKTAGIKERDIIVGIDDMEITSMTDLKNELSYYRVGEKITVVVMRMENNEFVEQKIEVVLGKAQQ